MAIWFDPALSIDKLRPLGTGTLSEALGMEWLEVGDNFLKARMPVDHRTRQPYGLLHGGASCALAETIGSVGSAMVIDHARFYCVGLEINANHIRGVKEGFVTGVATPLHMGKTTHVWDIKIFDDNNKLVAVCRLTMAIIQRKE